MKKFRMKKVLMFTILFVAAVAIFGSIVMALWNAILPAVLGVKTISFIQALGILVLSKILFGGFGRRGGWQGRGDHWKKRMQAKLANMTPDEKEKFKAEWKRRCGGRMWNKHEEKASTENAG